MQVTDRFSRQSEITVRSPFSKSSSLLSRFTNMPPKKPAPTQTNNLERFLVPKSKVASGKVSKYFAPQLPGSSTNSVVLPIPGTGTGRGAALIARFGRKPKIAEHSDIKLVKGPTLKEEKIPLTVEQQKRREEELKVLAHFDFSMEFGPMSGSTRRWRWNRAAKFGDDPPAIVMELLDANKGDFDYIGYRDINCKLLDSRKKVEFEIGRPFDEFE